MPLFVIIATFFLCGFCTAFNGILVPYLRDALELPYTAIVCVQASFFLAYFIWSPLAGMLFRERGYEKGLRWGLVAATLGTGLLIFCGFRLSFPLFLLGIFVLGGGIAVLQVTGNPSAMFLGSEETASSRLFLCQASTSFGMILAPYLGACTLLSAADLAGPASAAPLLTAFSTTGVAWLLVLGLAVLVALPHIQERKAETKGASPALRDPVVLVGMFAIALAVGAETAVASFLVPFLSDESVVGMSLESAGKTCMLFWTGLLVGRLGGSLLLKRMSVERLMVLHAGAGFSLAIVASVSTGILAAAAVLSLGLCLSVMFPAIFSLVLERCSCEKSVASGLLCMANIGGAMIPLAQGLLADRSGVHSSFVLPAICFLLLAAAGCGFYLLIRLHKRNQLSVHNV